MKSASKIGSSTSFNAACTTRSAVVGIPSRRILPDAFGIVFSRTRCGTNRPALRSSRSSASSSRSAERRQIAERSRRHRRCVHPCCPAPGSTRPRGTPGHRRGCTDHRTDGQDRPSPIGAASSASRVPALGLVEVGPRSAGIHQRPPRQRSMLRTRWTPSPCGRLSRPRTTTGPPPHPGGISRRRAFPPTPAGCGPGRGPPGWFPRSLSNRSTGSAPSYAPAASPRLRRRPSPWPPDRRHHPAQEFPATTHRSPSPGARCYPAQIRQVRAGGSLEGRSAAGSSRTPFRLACRTRTIWQYWPVPALSGLLPALTPVSGDQAALSFNRAAATSRR